MRRSEILRSLVFGARIAEEEADDLGDYFVETEAWIAMFAGKADIVYGAKGAGKSAIYSLLLARQDELLRKRILPISAENPRGAAAFEDLRTEPPASHEEFRSLWKAYVLVRIVEKLCALHPRHRGVRNLRRVLSEAKLLPGGDLSGFSLADAVRSVRRFVSEFPRVESFEPKVEIDPVTGLPKGFAGKITLRSPTPDQTAKGVRSIDQLLGEANAVLAELDLAAWLLFDRLDVAFAESQELERNALLSLFRTYLDLKNLDRVSLKLFLRVDIWNRITSAGFREASHITRDVKLVWSRDTLRNLIVRRLLRNPGVSEYYETPAELALASAETQEELLSRILPDRFDSETGSRSAFDWLISRTSDGYGNSAPRELIHLFGEATRRQNQYLELGEGEPGESRMFHGRAFLEGLSEVSRAYVQQTVFAEYPELKDAIEDLESTDRLIHTPDSLAELWSVEREASKQRATRLCDIGVLALRGSRQHPQYSIPFLVRPALGLPILRSEYRTFAGGPDD